MYRVTVENDGYKAIVESDRDDMEFEEFMLIIACPALAAIWSEKTVDEYFELQK